MKTTLKNHLIPHAGNEYRPHLLQRTAMVGMVGMILLTFFAANLQALIWVNVDWLVSTVLPAVVVKETNENRADDNLGLLTRNATLDAAAQLKAEHMAELGYFAHYAPDGTSPWFWFREAGYPFVHAGENLAVHFNDSKRVVRAWMDSPTHRANILNGDYTQIGIGVAEGEYEGYDTVFVVQLFGTPAVATPPTNRPPVTETPAPQAVTVVTEQVIEPVSTPVETPSVASAEESVVTDTSVAEVVDDTAIPYQLPSTDTLAFNEVNLDLEPSPEVVEDVVVADNAVATNTALAIDEPPADQFMSTTTDALPASVESQGPPASSPVASTFFSFVTQPQVVLQFLYLMIGAVVTFVLAVSISIEWRRQQPLQVAYSLLLLFAMGGLWFLHSVVTSSVTII